MTPIETLMEEHRTIERVIDAMETWAGSLTTASHDENVELKRFVQFIQEFADAIHHGKEEDILFAAMIKHGFPREQGPIAVMLHEHGLGRGIVNTMAALARLDTPWGETDRQRVKDAVASYAALLRPHIDKEDNILYRMAEMHLQGAAMDDVARHFDMFASKNDTTSRKQVLLSLADELTCAERT